ncbi:GNAT family N-acetyltransferase [Phyllobacterium sp. NPDC097923]|uniref:GNAT family N-acetyltransferase n=1 Tax=Phyllobacterium sp. NPDC097923 TaxID=3364404 RepID=UPI003839DB1F
MITFDNVQLRAFRYDEVETLRAIERVARSRYAQLDGFAAVVQAPPIAVERFLSGETVVAEATGKACGYVLMQPLDGMMYIANIMVEPAASGRGVGAGLLAAVHSRAMELNLSGIALTTFKSPRWNGPWFRKAGFMPMPDDRIGDELAAILSRHATFLDMSKRETLWKKLDDKYPGGLAQFLPSALSQG